jgi:hypothetical protein
VVVKRTLVVVAFLLLAAAPSIASAGKQQSTLLPPEAEADSPDARDRKPPELHISVTPAVLTDPNGRLRPIEISGEAEDDGDIEDLYLASVQSDERGAAGDVAGERIGSFDDRIFLRAERDPRGNGRTYRITYVAVDAAGNRAMDTATVTVPVDES